MKLCKKLDFISRKMKKNSYINNEIIIIFNILENGDDLSSVCEFYIEFSKFLENPFNLHVFNLCLVNYDFLYGDGLERIFEWAVNNIDIKTKAELENLKRHLVMIREENKIIEVNGGIKIDTDNFYEDQYLMPHIYWNKCYYVLDSYFLNNYDELAPKCV